MDKKMSNISLVYGFSLLQIVKNKTFIILTVICAVMMMIITPVMTIMSKEVSSSDKSTIERVEIIDDNHIFNNTKVISKKDTELKGFGKIKFSLIDEKFEFYKDDFSKESKNTRALLVHITNKAGKYILNIYKHKDSKVTDNDLTAFITSMTNYYNGMKIVNMKLDADQSKLINTPVLSKVHVDGVSDSDKESNISIIMIILFVTMFFIVLSGENISTQIVTEKSTKLVEYLLTSIKPIDLVIGKIMAAVTVSLLQIVVMIGSGLASMRYCKSKGMIKSYDDALAMLKIKDIVNDVNIEKVLLIILFLVAGFIFYSIIACCLSSTVSRLEDLGNIGMMFSVIILVAVYTIMAVVSFASGNGQILEKIILFVPFTAVFIVPAYILLGKMSIMLAVASLLVQLICLLVCGVLTSKIYMSLIMYTGKKVTFKQLFALLRKDKVGEISE